MNQRKAKLLRKIAKSFADIDAPDRLLLGQQRHHFVTYRDKNGNIQTVDLLPIQAVNSPKSVRGVYLRLKKNPNGEEL